MKGTKSATDPPTWALTVRHSVDFLNLEAQKANSAIFTGWYETDGTTRTAIYTLYCEQHDAIRSNTAPRALIKVVSFLSRDATSYKLYPHIMFIYSVLFLQ
jgi:hypothetical protein